LEVISFDGRPVRRVLETMEENLAGHVSFLPGVTEGMLVEAASDLPTHTFNAVCRAKLGRDSATRQRDAAEHRGIHPPLKEQVPAVLLVGGTALRASHPR